MPNPRTIETWHSLTQDQRETAGEFARLKGPGRYTLREIYGDQWQFVKRPRRFGFLFKRAVLAGAVAGVRWVGQKSNRSLLYEVYT